MGSLYAPPICFSAAHSTTAFTDRTCLPLQIYSRNSEDNTGKYPDIAALVPAQLQPGVRSVVLDAEAVAWDRQANKVLPFQVLSNRKRKDVTVENIQV